MFPIYRLNQYIFLQEKCSCQDRQGTAPPLGKLRLEDHHKAKLAWPTQGVLGPPGLHSETLSEKQQHSEQ